MSLDARVTDHNDSAELEALLTAAESKIAHLETALASSRRIGAAIGVVMALHKITEDAAFQLLSKASQAQNRKLRELADDVVRIGTVPVPARRSAVRRQPTLSATTSTRAAS